MYEKQGKKNFLLSESNQWRLSDFPTALFLIIVEVLFIVSKLWLQFTKRSLFLEQYIP